MTSAGTQLLEEDMSLALKDHNYYEAYQLYLSISQRLLKQKKPLQALRKLIEGIKTFNSGLEAKEHDRTDPMHVGHAPQHKIAIDLAQKYIQYLATVLQQEPAQAVETEPGAFRASVKDLCIDALNALSHHQGYLQSTTKDTIAKLLETYKCPLSPPSTGVRFAHSKEDLNSMYEVVADHFLDVKDYHMAIKYFTLSSSEGCFTKHVAFYSSLLNDPSFVAAPTTQGTLGGIFDHVSQFVTLVTSSVLQYLTLKRHQEPYVLLTSILTQLQHTYPALFTSVKTVKIQKEPIASTAVSNENPSPDFSVFILVDQYQIFNWLQCLVFALCKNSRPHYLKLKTQYSKTILYPPSSASHAHHPLATDRTLVLSAENCKDLDALEMVYFGSLQGPQSSASGASGPGSAGGRVSNIAGAVQSNVGGLINNVFTRFFSSSHIVNPSTPTPTPTPPPAQSSSGQAVPTGSAAATSSDADLLQTAAPSLRRDQTGPDLD